MSADTDRLRALLADPLDVATRLGLADGAKRTPGGLMVRCVVHGDRRPSCSVTRGPDGTLRWRCFSCGAKGNLYGLIAAVHALDVHREFRRVYVVACELAGVSASDRESNAREGCAPAPRPAAPLPRTDSALGAARFHNVAAAVISCGSIDAPEAADVRAYLARRGLLDEARADAWGALPDLAAVRAHVDLADLAASGLTDPGASRWLRPEHRLCIPWRSADGQIVTLQRRRIDAAPTERYVLPHGRPPTWPYGVERLTAEPADAPIVIVEGAADVLAARALARGPIVALGLAGVASWRASWASLTRGRRVLVALDADAAGDRAADVLARDLAAAGASHVERVRPPGAKDWCDALASRRRAA